MFLDMDVLKKRNDRRKSMVNLGDGDASPGNPSSRRGSFVKTKEEPVKDMKAIDQERRQAKKDAKLARYLKPISLNHQSHFYTIVTSSWYQTTKQRIPNLRICLTNIYYDFFFNWQTEKKQLFRTNKKFVFFFDCSN